MHCERDATAAFGADGAAGPLQRCTVARKDEPPTLGELAAIVKPTLRRCSQGSLRSPRTAGWWGWTAEGEDEPHATIGYEANLVDPGAAWLRLHYQSQGEPIDYRVRLVTTTPTYGGLRWWFICPLMRRDGGPPRQVARLYLPPGSRYFGSREAHGLTYASCQQSGKFRGLFRHLAGVTGTDEATIRAALTRRSPR